MNKTEIINLIRTEAKKRNITLKQLGSYAGMKSTYINKFLGGKINLPSYEKLEKIGKILNIDFTMLAENSPEFLKKQNEELKKQNEQLKKSLQKYEKLSYIYDNFEELDKMRIFLKNNEKIINVIQDYKF